MTWIRRAEPTPKPKHLCGTPMREPGLFGRLPDGSIGDLWRCDVDDCRRLWRIGYLAGERAWRPAWWWQLLRYRRDGYTSVLNFTPLKVPPPPPPPVPGQRGQHVVSTAMILPDATTPPPPPPPPSSGR